MKYSSNSLEDFYIHDTNLDQFGYQDDECIFIVSSFGVKSTCEANPNTYDMQVNEGLIRFKGIDFKEMCYKGYKKYNDKNQIVDIILDKYIHIDEIDCEIGNIIDLCPQIYMCNRIDDGNYCFTILCEKDIIEVIFSFDSVSVEWNFFEGKAWYVKD